MNATATMGHNEATVRLGVIAHDAQIALERVARGEADAIEGWLAYGSALNEGRALFHPEDDKGFGQWVADLHRQLVGVEPNDHERAAAMWAAANPDEFEQARAAGRARTVRGIHAKWKEIDAAKNSSACDYGDGVAPLSDADDTDVGLIDRAWDRMVSPDPATNSPQYPSRDALMREIKAEQAEKAAAKREARNEKERALAARIREGAKALEGAKEYGVILAEALAERWQCSAETIRAMCRQGRLPHFRSGRMIRIRAQVVEDYECGNIGSDGSRADSSSPGTMEAPADVIVLTHSRPRTQSAKPAT